MLKPPAKAPIPYFQERFPEFKRKTTHIWEIHTIFTLSASLKSLQSKLRDFLSTYPGYRILFEKNLCLEDYQDYHFNYGQNPTCSLYLFSSECRESTCLGPCLFKHKHSIRSNDLKAITKFKFMMIQTLLSILDRSEIVLNDYKKEDYDSLEESVFRMTIGEYSCSKLTLMNHVFGNTLFQSDERMLPTQKKEVGTKFSFCRYHNKVRAFDFIFVLSLCYLPIWLEDEIYSRMRFTHILTNLEMSELKISLYEEIKKLFSPNDTYLVSLKEKEMGINLYLNNCIHKVLFAITKLPVKEQENFLYHTSLEQKIARRNSILTSS